MYGQKYYESESRYKITIQIASFTENLLPVELTENIISSFVTMVLFVIFISLTTSMVTMAMAATGKESLSESKSVILKQGASSEQRSIPQTISPSHRKTVSNVD